MIAPALLLAACEDPPPAETPVAHPSLNLPAQQTACALLQPGQVQPALQPAPSGSPTASASPVPVESPAPVVRTVAVTIGGAPQPALASQCAFAGSGTSTIVVTVLPPQKAGTVQFKGTVAELSDYTDNATMVSFGGTTAYLQSNTQAAAITFQRGGDVVSIAYQGSEVSGGTSREQRLADLAATILGTPAPSLPAVGAPVASNSSSSASATPKPPAGEKTQGATAASTVKESDQLKFAPETVSVKVGDVVEWDNGGQVPHNVTFSGQPGITSSTMNGGDKYQVKFTAPGTYSYVCTFHVAQQMQGSVTVTG